MGLWRAVSSFFTGSGFEPHGACYLWTPGLITLNVVSDALIALAYYSIPLLLMYFVRKRRDVPFSMVFVMFSVFILACGTTHAISIYNVWHGAYWLDGAVKAVTAAASLATAVLCIPLLPLALTMRSPAELDRANRELSKTLQEKEELLALYRREKRVATMLQEALLPQTMPTVPGLAFDACYLAGATDAEIGGDWYDAFVREDGIVFLSIGDVAGRGLTAAATMGTVRQTLRTLGQQETDPSRILQFVHMGLDLDAPDTMATAIVALYDPETSMLRYANAGHPSPLVRRADGSVVALEQRGLPLGVLGRMAPPQSALLLEPGSSVLFYTDGLIESSRDVIAGIDALQVALQGMHPLAPSARELVDRVIPEGSHDDVAVLIMSVAEPSSNIDVSFRATPASSHVARRALRRALENCGLPVAKIDDAEVAAGEAIMNVVEHAYGAGNGSFRLQVCDADDIVTIVVADEGRWRIRPSADGRGRGIGIMRHFVDDVKIVTEDSGTSVTLTVNKESCTALISS